ncbi:hypothetical protein JCM3774_000068 [Rhodotorula dairenensis]
MRVNVLQALALVLATCIANVAAADLSGLISSASSTAASSSSSAASSSASASASSGSGSASASASNSQSSSSGGSSSASSSASGVSLSQSVIVSQSLSVNGNQTVTLNVTSTSTMTATTPLTTAATPQGLASITAYAPGQTASGVALGPNDGYIAAAGRAQMAVGAVAAGAAAFVLLA